MKAINIAYWVITIIIAGLMLFSGITNAMVTKESVEMISTGLGYPDYMVRFLGIAKVLGAIVILIPAFPRLKEWAYAGLFFDLFGATYSIAAKGGGAAEILPMAGFIIVLFASYFLHLKRLKAGKP